MNSENKLKVTTPGRICLFGEHQDYLLLPVIPAAISLRIGIDGETRSDSKIFIDLPDIHSNDHFYIGNKLSYKTERDYFRSAFNVLCEEGFTFSKGLNSTVRSTIPIKAGTSSSSALVVTWINFLSQMSDNQANLLPEDIARLAHKAEVLEFNEPGGMMDQYSTSFGGILYLDFYPTLKYRRLETSLGKFVLGDSQKTKDTKRILSQVKNRILEIARKLSLINPDFSLHKISVEEIDRYSHPLTNDETNLLRGTIRNHAITLEAASLFDRQPFDEVKFGMLLNEHQSILRDILHISTSKIDRMLEVALEAGALGGKINGSGGGGCMFVYAPKQTEIIAEAITMAGGKAYIIHVDEGTRIENQEVKK